MTDHAQTRPEIYRQRAALMLKLAEEAPNAKLRATYLWLSDDWNRRYFLEQASIVREWVEQAQLDSIRVLYQELLSKLEAMADDAFRARTRNVPATTNDLITLLRQTLSA